MRILHAPWDGKLPEDKNKLLAEAIEKDLYERGKLSKFGDAIHKLLEIKLTEKFGLKPKEGLSDYETELDDIVTSIINEKKLYKEDISIFFSDSTSVDEDNLKDKFTELVNDTIDILEKQLIPEGSKIFSEAEVHTTLLKSSKDGNKIGLRGKCDLIVVTPDNKVKIIDFKCASKLAKNWSSVKKAHNGYQLGVYRAILQNAGIPFNNIELYNIPIHIPYKNFMESEVEKTIVDSRSLCKD